MVANSNVLSMNTLCNFFAQLYTSFHTPDNEFNNSHTTCSSDWQLIGTSFVPPTNQHVVETSKNVVFRDMTIKCRTLTLELNRLNYFHTISTSVQDACHLLRSRPHIFIGMTENSMPTSSDVCCSPTDSRNRSPSVSILAALLGQTPHSGACWILH